MRAGSPSGPLSNKGELLRKATMRVYRNLVRPILFGLDPELAHRVAIHALRPWPLWMALGLLLKTPQIPARVAGLDVPNPIGLAAGWDKDCEALPALSRLGFGYVTCGTVTLDGREGNPKPRMVREQRRHALINSMGFPNKGLDSAVRNISRARNRIGDARIFASVSGTEIDDIATCHRTLEPWVDALEINISSPNTKGLRIFHSPDTLAELLGEINAERSKPLFVKLPPFPAKGEDAESHKAALGLMEVCVSNGVNALTIANTKPVNDDRLAVGSGGLSGKPIYPQMLRMVEDARNLVGDSVAINASGGIFTAEDASRAMDAGATTVQALTGLVYEGPYIARAIAKGLAEQLADNAAAALGTVRQRV